MNQNCLVAESQYGIKEVGCFSEQFLIFEINILAWEIKSDMLKFQMPVIPQTVCETLRKLLSHPPFTSVIASISQCFS